MSQNVPTRSLQREVMASYIVLIRSSSSSSSSFICLTEKKEIIQFTSQGNYGEETSRNHQAYKRGHLGCH